MNIGLIGFLFRLNQVKMRALTGPALDPKLIVDQIDLNSHINTIKL